MTANGKTSDGIGMPLVPLANLRTHALFRSDFSVIVGERNVILHYDWSVSVAGT